MGRPRRPIEERFWEKVDVRGPDECWPWQAATEKKMGYGRFQVPDGGNGHSEPAHRVAYELHYRTKVVNQALHECDNPPCCNPAHVYDGTHGENMRDRDDRGRTNRGPNPAKGHPGEAHWRCKLSDGQVADIRQRYSNGGITQQRLADEYGVHQTQISRIVLGFQRK